MKRSESLFIHFIRGFTLLATLVAIPGMAICWNYLPKYLLNPDSSSYLEDVFQKDSCKTTDSIPFLATGAGDLELAETFLTQMTPPNAVDTANDVPIPPYWAVPEAPIQQVSWNRPETESLWEDRLKSLGVVHHQLEKWGNRGELVRFSCTVTPSAPYTYKKYFQAIGEESESVIESVLADVEQWKSNNEKR